MPDSSTLLSPTEVERQLNIGLPIESLQKNSANVIFLLFFWKEAKTVVTGQNPNKTVFTSTVILTREKSQTYATVKSRGKIALRKEKISRK